MKQEPESPVDLLDELEAVLAETSAEGAAETALAEAPAENRLSESDFAEHSLPEKGIRRPTLEDLQARQL